MTETFNGQVMAQPMLPESVAKSLALQLAQVALDKAVLESRLAMILDAVHVVLHTTKWIEPDTEDGRITAVVDTPAMQRLQSVVLGSG